MLFVSVGAILAIYLILKNEHAEFAAIWTAAHSCVAVARIITWTLFLTTKPYERENFHEVQNGWKAVYVSGLWLSGMLWSALALSICIPSDGGGIDTKKYVVIIILSAMAGGATGIAATYKYVGIGYVSLLLLPGAAALSFGGEQERILGALGVVFWLVMAGNLRANNAALHRTLDLEAKNQELIDNLSQANFELEAKVSHRTIELRELAHSDALTGLPNRRGLSDWWQKLERVSRASSYAILFLDLDRFKQINDVLGHEAGDRVLATMAHKIGAIIPVNGLLARWGGDEFVAVVPAGIDAQRTVKDLADMICNVATMPLTIGNTQVQLGVSTGWSLLSAGAESFDDIVHEADLAATEVKRTGRGKVLAYSETIAEGLRRKFDLSRALIQAIGSDQIYLVYQPIVDAHTGVVHSYEALCRWKHPVLGIISPDEFIRIAEDTDCIATLGTWILEQACKDAVIWRKDGNAAGLAVNVSIKQLVQPSLPLVVARILGDTGLPPEVLDLEVTESVFDDGYIDRVTFALDSLRKLGVNLHIDDFGTGYSSLSRLGRLSVHGIKVDKAFVADLEGQGQVIIESTLTIARAFGLKVVAEGVETGQQLCKLQSMGVDLLQGYYFSPPTSLEQILQTKRAFSPNAAIR
ncbi:bifunctional diguanylate cyclase/phosphodiesterase [Asticcacaulis sp. AND118]|uniref:putative bifunctional diguanylate cyclase/phosphodiesterase n=1 Tax=Asticcacaulis sp. AND118 TaxID=2840468 RepID=UPI001CFF5830|nr:bifunctional diguanylate cyclase/phosphodiesterase [Asticcacaulis sp. AND118]UDF05754.1 bifunctional diguanylate cyclase/phosphodiesterase [Asticcacaulis sp. AND118]